MAGSEAAVPFQWIQPGFEQNPGPPFGEFGPTSSTLAWTESDRERQQFPTRVNRSCPIEQLQLKRCNGDSLERFVNAGEIYVVAVAVAVCPFLVVLVVKGKPLYLESLPDRRHRRSAATSALFLFGQRRLERRDRPSTHRIVGRPAPEKSVGEDVVAPRGRRRTSPPTLVLPLSSLLFPVRSQGLEVTFQSIVVASRQ